MDLPVHDTVVQTVIEEGWVLTRSGDPAAGEAKFRAAHALDPKVNAEELTARMREDALNQLSKEVMVAANHQDVRSTTTALQRALTLLDPPPPVLTETWNRLCWWGSLYGFAAQVAESACELALAAGETEQNVGYHNSRGLARALSGNLIGAVEDFTFVVNRAESDGRDAAFIASRRQWLEQLKAGKNPFDEATLAQLRAE